MHPKATTGLAVAQAMNLSPGLPSHCSLLEGWDRKEGGGQEEKGTKEDEMAG